MTKLVAVPQKLCCGARDAVGSCVSVHGVCMVCAWYVCVCVARVVCSAQNRATQAANNKSRNKVEGGGEEKEGKRKMLSLSLRRGCSRRCTHLLFEGKRIHQRKLKW